MTKKKNVVKKFQTFMTHLNPEEKRDIYNLLALVRGPDNGDEDIKHETTKKIRYLLKLNEPGSGINFCSETFRRYPAFSTDPLDLSYLEHYLDIPLKTKPSDCHFAVHVEDAVTTLKRLKIL